MCGIIGYIGPKEVVPVLIDGLRRLEYRGYDSAGVAVVRNGESTSGAAPESCRISKTSSQDIRSQAITASGTRAGRRTDARRKKRASAPRLHRQDRRRPQRHHRELPRSKRELQQQGHKFVTETDTEIVAHLVEREMKDDGSRERRQARADADARPVRAGADFGRGSRKIVAVRNGPPIVVGLGDGEFFVASDIPAILSHTRDVVFLGDEEMAIITRSGVQFTDFARPV